MSPSSEAKHQSEYEISLNTSELVCWSKRLPRALCMESKAIEEDTSRRTRKTTKNVKAREVGLGGRNLRFLATLELEPGEPTDLHYTSFTELGRRFRWTVGPSVCFYVKLPCQENIPHLSSSSHPPCPSVKASHDSHDGLSPL